MSTRVKVVVQRMPDNVAGWPCINYDYEKETGRIMEVVAGSNPETEFDVVYYTSMQQAQDDYENDLKIYDGVLVIVMANAIGPELFYTQQSKNGLPTVIADVPLCGTGSVLTWLVDMRRREKYPVPIISSRDYRDIARAARSFYVLKRIKESKILVVRNSALGAGEKQAHKVWGCDFEFRTSEDLMRYFNAVPRADAEAQADRWIGSALGVIEPSREDVIDGALVYLALEQMKKDCGADAVTVDCLGLSYSDMYGKGRRLYPCLAFHQMNNDGELGVCEADIFSTITSMVTLYMTGRPGFVSDPAIDTSSDQIIYAHCVASSKVFGPSDVRTCPLYIRSHAEDQKGASVQVIFPEGEQLTTVQHNFVDGWASIHSSVSCGNVGGDNGCRSKLAAACRADNILENWMPMWHRVTLFGNYRRELKNLFIMKGFRIVEEDKDGAAL